MNSDNNLTLGEYIDICALLEECAKRAIAESQYEFRPGTAVNIAEKGSEEFSQLIDVYKSSTYAQLEDPLYTKYVTEQVEKRMGDIAGRFRNSDRARILIPVVFYSLISLNESNSDTVKRRINKVHVQNRKGDITIPWGNTNPYRPWKPKYRPTNNSEALSESIIKVSQGSAGVSFTSSDFVSSDAKEAAQQIKCLKGRMHYLQCASSMAREGVFLLDILTSRSMLCSPLDTLLRLYCVNSLRDVLKICRLIADDQNTIVVSGKIMFKQYKSIDIALEYALNKCGYAINYDINSDLDEKYDFPITLQKDKNPAVIKEFMNRTANRKVKFKEIYSFLKHNFVFSFPNIIPFYLNREKLEPLIGAENMITDYIYIQKKLTECLSQTRYHVTDIQRVLSCIGLIKSRQDILAIQPCISEYKTSQDEYDAAKKKLEEEQKRMIAIDPQIKDSLLWKWFFEDGDNEILEAPESGEYDEEDTSDSLELSDE